MAQRPSVTSGAELATVDHLTRSRPLSRSLFILDIDPVMTALVLEDLNRV